MGPQRDMSYSAGGEPSAYPAYPGSGDSRAARPPLTKRMRLGHWTAIDCAVGLFAAVCDVIVVMHHLAGDGPRLPLALLFMATVFLPVALRRRAPVVAFAALLILGVLLARLSPAVPAAIFLAAAYVLYTVTVQARKRTGAASLVLLLAVMIGLSVAGTTGTVGGGPRAVRVDSTDTGIFVPVGLAGVIAWMTGYSVRQRRRYVVTLQQQAASSAVAEERLRIARELHDVVAHSMSVIAVQAGYGQYVIDTSPDGARDALGAIQATSRDALEEMRRMLGVLRQQDTGAAEADQGGAGPAILTGPGSAASAEGAATGQPPGSSSPASPGRAPLAPAPGLAGLERLVVRTRGAGVHVALDIAGQPRSAPAGVDLSAYRIIQEALTNVVRHAGTGAVCAVSVTYTDLDLVIHVTDDGGRSAPSRSGGSGRAGTGVGGTDVTATGPGTGSGLTGPGVTGTGLNGAGSAATGHANTGAACLAGAGAGHGIIGMRERVHLCGGSFNAGPLPAGGFQVMAALPLPAAVYRDASGPQARRPAAAAVPATPSPVTSGLVAPGLPALGPVTPSLTTPSPVTPSLTTPSPVTPSPVADHDPAATAGRFGGQA